jgi:hypothetical protein
MRLTTVVALCLICAGCASAASGNRPDSGVSGVAVIDVGCAVVHGSACPTEPLRARIVAVRDGGSETAGSAESDSDGRFRITLEPGRYVLRGENLGGAPVPSAMPVEVEVPSGRYVETTVQFDSGVRGPA